MQTKQNIKQEQVSVIPIYPNEIDKYWGLVEFLIAEALKYSGGFANAHHIKDELKKDAMQLFIMFGEDDDGENKVFGCCTTRIFQNPNYKELQPTMCTGKKMHLWVEQLRHTLEKFAKDNDCKRICLIGRPGWKKFIVNHGWKVKHYEYQKEIK